MTWWGTSLNGQSLDPKFKKKFLIEFGNGGYLLSAKSVSKPSVTIEKKEYTMINHSYSYPGIPKWDPITIKFVDSYLWGDKTASLGGESLKDEQRSVGHQLWEMLLATGYVNPRNQKSYLTSVNKNKLYPVVSPEKAATISRAFGGVLKIHQIGNHTYFDAKSNKHMFKEHIQDTWSLYNPIITKIQWGDLDYSDDAMVECTLEIAYDWAEFEAPKPKEKEITKG
jgi:hypothetical protein